MKKVLPMVLALSLLAGSPVSASSMEIGEIASVPEEEQAEEETARPEQTEETTEEAPAQKKSKKKKKKAAEKEAAGEEVSAGEPGKEEDSPVPEEEEIRWEEIAPRLEERNLTGRFVTFDEVALSFYLLDGFYEVNLTKENREEGYIGYYATGDQKYQIAVMYVDGLGMTREEYIGVLPDLGAEDLTLDTINGLPVLVYRLPEDDSLVASLMTEDGHYAELTFYPQSDEGMAALTDLMLCSIMEEGQQDGGSAG